MSFMMKTRYCKEGGCAWLVMIRNRHMTALASLYHCEWKQQLLRVLARSERKNG